MHLLLAEQANILPSIDPEAIFGGVILLFVLGLLVVGKLRLDREITAMQAIIDVHMVTIEQQKTTIEALIARDNETLHLLRELRDAAMRRGDIS